MSWQVLLSHFGREFQPQRAEGLGCAGGFSGAIFWRLTTPKGRLCVRRWPRQHPTPDRLREIHAVLIRASDRGCAGIPRPLVTRNGDSFIEHDGHLWELAPWLPGEADYRARPTESRLRAAMRALANFHLAAAPAERVSVEVSPGIAARIERLQSLAGGGLDRLRQDTARRGGHWPALAERGRRLFELFAAAAPGVERRLIHSCSKQTALQPCIRDVWHDHVLFQEDTVTGLIDFGALRTDNVATDIARLLGSLVGDERHGWEVGLAAYGDLRPLSTEERDLVRAFDESAVLMSGLSWVEWVFRDGRAFDARSTVLSRVDENIARLTNLAGRTAS
jgi:Ser/Thr protein kinase RdoA (MazF antagonist)